MSEAIVPVSNPKSKKSPFVLQSRQFSTSSLSKEEKMKNEKRKKLGRIFSWIAGIAIVAIWVVAFLDVNVWRHLTGGAATVDWIIATFLSISLAYLAGKA
jgi:ABC-type phosphate/phosphonate transport system permease subunit